LLYRHAESAQDSEEYLWLRAVLLAGAVEVLEEDPGVSREGTKRHWDLRCVVHD
jgi:hypothetical protein